MKKYAYITMLTTNDYLPATIGLMYSGKNTNSQYPFYIMVTPNISTINIQILEYIGYHILYIEDFVPQIYQEHYDALVKQYDLKIGGDANTSGYVHTYNCVHAGKGTNFDKLCFLDSDTLVLKNLDKVFNYSNFGTIHYQNEIDVNTAFFMIEPSEQTYKDLLAFADKYPKKRLSSITNILNGFFEKELYNKSAGVPDIYHFDHMYLNNEHLLPSKLLQLRAIHFGGPHRPGTNGTEYVNSLGSEWGYYKYLYKYYKNIINLGIKEINTQLALELPQMK